MNFDELNGLIPNSPVKQEKKDNSKDSTPSEAMVVSPQATERLFGLKIKVYPTKTGLFQVYTEVWPMGEARKMAQTRKAKPKKNLAKIKVENVEEY